MSDNDVIKVEVLDKKKHVLEIAGIIINIVVILVMCAALLVALQANGLSRKAIGAAEEANKLNRVALRNSNVPWMQAENIRLELDGNQDSLRILYDIHNYGKAPAISSNVKLEFDGVKDSPPNTMNYDKSIIMPEHPHSGMLFVINKPLCGAKVLHDAITSSQVRLTFVIDFWDVLNSQYTIRHKVAYQKDTFRTISYSIDRLTDVKDIP